MSWTSASPSTEQPSPVSPPRWTGSPTFPLPCGLFPACASLTELQDRQTVLGPPSPFLQHRPTHTLGPLRGVVTGPTNSPVGPKGPGSPFSPGAPSNPGLPGAPGKPTDPVTPAGERGDSDGPALSPPWTDVAWAQSGAPAKAHPGLGTGCDGGRGTAQLLLAPCCCIPSA